MNPHSNFDELDLLAYVDGHLDDDPFTRARVEARLSRSPELAAKARAYLTQTEALREAYGERLTAPIPARILDPFDRPATPSRWGWALTLTIVAALVFGGLAGWSIGSRGHSNNDAEGRLVSAAYASLEHTPDRRQPLENAGLIKDGPDDALRVLNIHAPNLSRWGFALTKSEILNPDGTQLDRLTYLSADGQKLSLFLAPRWIEKRQGIRIATKGHLSFAHWLQGPLASVLVSKLPAAQLRPLAIEVRRAIRHQRRLQPNTVPVAKPTLTRPTFASEQGGAPIPAAAVRSSGPVSRSSVPD